MLVGGGPHQGRGSGAAASLDTTANLALSLIFAFLFRHRGDKIFVVPRQFSQDIGEWPENQILIPDWAYFHCPGATLPSAMQQSLLWLLSKKKDIATSFLTMALPSFSQFYHLQGRGAVKVCVAELSNGFGECRDASIKKLVQFQFLFLVYRIPLKINNF